MRLLLGLALLALSSAASALDMRGPYFTPTKRDAIAASTDSLRSDLTTESNTRSSADTALSNRLDDVAVSTNATAAQLTQVAADTTTIQTQLDQVAVDTTTLFNSRASSGMNNDITELHNAITMVGNGTAQSSFTIRTSDAYSATPALLISNQTNSGAIRFGENAGAYGLIEFNYSGGRLNITNHESNTASGISLYPNTGVEAMTMLGSGHVGIGTSSPCSTCTLHVNGSMSMKGTLQILGNSSNIILNDDDVGEVAYIYTGNNDFTLAYVNGRSLRIDDATTTRFKMDQGGAIVTMPRVSSTTIITDGSGGGFRLQGSDNSLWMYAADGATLNGYLENNASANEVRLYAAAGLTFYAQGIKHVEFDSTTGAETHLSTLTVISATDAQGIEVRNTVGRAYIVGTSILNAPAAVALGDTGGEVGVMSADRDNTSGTLRFFTESAAHTMSFETGAQTQAMWLGSSQQAVFKGTVTVLGANGLSISAPSYPTLTFTQDVAGGKWGVQYYGGGLNFFEVGVSDYRLFLKDGGNVGVNESSPVTRFEATEGSSANPSNDVNPVASGVFRYNQAGEGITFGAYASSVTWMQAQNRTTSNTHRDIAINPDGGNIGVGTGAPGARVHIEQGNLTGLGTKASAALLVGGGGTTNSVSFIGYGYTGGTYMPVAAGAVVTAQTGFTTADYVIATRDGTSDIAPTERLRIDSTGALTSFPRISSRTVTMDGSGASIEVTDASLNSNPFIKVSNDARSCNLQVVAAHSDSFELDCADTAAADFGIDTSGNVFMYENSADASKSIFIGKSDGTSGWTIGSGIVANDGKFRIYSNDRGATALEVDDADGKAYFNYNVLVTGAVGINNPAPVGEMEIKGYRTIASGYGQLQITDSNVSDDKQLAIGFDSDTDVAWMQARQWAVGYKNMVIQPDGGKLGFGTTNPVGAKVHVQANSGTQEAMLWTTPDYAAGTTGSSLLMQFGAVSGNTYANLNAYTTGGSAFGNLVLQAGGGKVGIDTTPSYKLHVVETAADTAAWLQGDGASDYAVYIKANSGTNGWGLSVRAGTAASDSLNTFATETTAGVQQVAIKNNGRVQMGTNPPSGGSIYSWGVSVSSPVLSMNNAGAPGAFILYDPTAATDEKYTAFDNRNGNLTLESINDAFSAVGTLLAGHRSGNSYDFMGMDTAKVNIGEFATPAARLEVTGHTEDNYYLQVSSPNGNALGYIAKSGKTCLGEGCSTTANAYFAVKGIASEGHYTIMTATSVYLAAGASQAIDAGGILDTNHGILDLVVDSGNCAGTVYLRGGVNTVTEMTDPLACIETTDTGSSVAVYYSGGYLIKIESAGAMVISLYMGGM